MLRSRIARRGYWSVLTLYGCASSSQPADQGEPGKFEPLAGDTSIGATRVQDSLGVTIARRVSAGGDTLFLGASIRNETASPIRLSWASCSLLPEILLPGSQKPLLTWRPWVGEWKSDRPILICHLAARLETLAPGEATQPVEFSAAVPAASIPVREAQRTVLDVRVRLRLGTPSPDSFNVVVDAGAVVMTPR